MSIIRNSKSLRLMTASMSTLAMMASAQSAFAQDNDVDGYDGTINASLGCVAAAITGANTLNRRGNQVSGTEHCVEEDSSYNQLSGF